MVLEEKQFELNGVVFGAGAPVELKDNGWAPGSAPRRTQRTDRPSGDGVRFGRDYKGSATWSFSLYTNGENEDEAWERLNGFVGAWDRDEDRAESDVVLPLRYCVAGKTRRVYGRPGIWTPTVNNQSIGGRIDIEADFNLVHHTIFDDELNTVEVSLGNAFEADAGLVVPFIVPFTSTAGAAVRESAVRIGGEVPTPVMITFVGPVDNAMVQIGDWKARLLDPVLPGNPVTIDARPWVMSASTQAGAGVRIAARETRIAKMWLPPGYHSIIFTGDDITSTAKLLVSWHDAYRTAR